MASSVLWEYTLVGRLMLCLLNIENHCVPGRLHVITLTSTREERSSCSADAPFVLWHQLLVFTFLLFFLFIFFYVHLSSSTPPLASYVALPLSLTVS